MLEQLDTIIAFAIVMLLLSLLITVGVQFVLTILGLRGSNLLWGIRRLLRQIDPRVAGHAKEIANALLRHPAITHIWRFRAVAVRKEELVRLLDDLHRRDPATTDDPPHRRILRKIVLIPALRSWLAEFFPHPAKILSSGARAVLGELLAVRVPQAGDTEIARVQALAAALGELMPSQSEAVRGVVDRMLTETNRLGAEVNAWFDTVMDRTSERFKLHSRVITAVLAFAFVIGLQINALDILRQLSNDDIRQQVLQIYEPATKMYEGVSGLEEERTSLATHVLEGLKSDPKHQAEFAAAGSIEQGLGSQSAGENWLQRNIKPTPEGLLEAYRAAFLEATEKLLGKTGEAAGQTSKLLEQTGLRVVPAPAELSAKWKKPFEINWLGILASGMFLSLGAPFWFNALRTLSDLRPVVARRVEGEPHKGAPKGDT